MPNSFTLPFSNESTEARAQQLFEEHSQAVYSRTDRLFAFLLMLEWLAAIVTAVVLSPTAWEGTISHIHIHVFTALFIGSLISSVPIYLALQHPGLALTRHTIAVAQMMYSALFIHLSGGRIETHFHVFGSLALLAIYRDWRVLLTATVVATLDHFVRGQYWPQSVYGVSSVTNWRWVEHAAWVVFEDIFLMRSCIENTAEMRGIAVRQAQLEQMNEVKAQERRFRTLCDLSPVGIFQTDNTGRNTFVNKRYTEITDTSANEALGDGWQNLLHPDEKEAVISAWANCVSAGETFSREIRVVGYNKGETRWVNVLANGVKDADDQFSVYVGTVEDITERKKSESKTAALAQIVELTNDGVCSYDLEGNIVSWNEAASKLFGFDRTEILGQPFSVLPEDHEFPSLLQKIVKGDLVVNHECTRTRKDGTQAEVAVTASALRDSMGKLSGVSVIARDITNKKEADKRIGEFYSTISHELRTPLTSIRGALSLMDDGIVDPASTDGQELIKIAKSSSIRLIRLINEILDLRKIESGKLPLHLASVKASALVTNAANAMLGMAAEAGVTIDIELNDEADVLADSDRIAQVLTNLMSNAIKFSNPGGSIEVRVESVEQAARFSVIDHGAGIPEHEQHKLFGRFQQVDSSDSRPKEGTGLGLAICKALVEEHQGKIGVVSRAGKGATFYFELPLAKVAKKEISNSDFELEPHVLLVEDDVDLAAVIVKQLASENIRCHAVSTKLDCMEFLRQHAPMVILLDLFLPDGNGLDVVDYLRNHADLHQVPIIVMSGDTSQRDFALPLVFEFMPKPFDQQTLLAALERAVGTAASKRVLIVDDDADTRAVMAAQLKSLQVQALQAADGQDAIAILQRTSPDLVILDVGMPNVDGFAVVDWLRAQKLIDIPVLIYSGRDLEVEELHALSLALTKHLVKGSATEAEFLDAVRHLLRTMVHAESELELAVA
jgi:PAS domain S-box-containing protein